VAAFSFIEIMFVLGTAATISAVAVPETLTSLDDSRASAAARYVATRLQRTRMEAVTRSAVSAVRFTTISGHYDFAGYEDGNHNGVLSRDIQSGIDRLVSPADRLGDHFPGVDFCATPGLPPVDATSPPPGANPVRLGVSNILSFTPSGTSSSGSLYICSQRRAQYVVRVYGDTGKTRILKFNPASGQWLPTSDL
jgi:type II secretory pathway pseudopilin PulG